MTHASIFATCVARHQHNPKMNPRAFRVAKTTARARVCGVTYIGGCDASPCTWSSCSTGPAWRSCGSSFRCCVQGHTTSWSPCVLRYFLTRNKLAPQKKGGLEAPLERGPYHYSEPAEGWEDYSAPQTQTLILTRTRVHEQR